MKQFDRISTFPNSQIGTKNPKMAQMSSPNSYISILQFSLLCPPLRVNLVVKELPRRKSSVRCSGNQIQTLRTCKNCKTQFDPLLNHSRACRYHSSHFGGETKRKFESVYTGGTMDTPDSGKVFQYWHCCGSEDPFDPGCTAAPHASYDD